MNKSLIVFIGSMLIASSSKCQTQPPNPSFENWESLNGPIANVYEEPDDWNSSNECSAIINQFSITKSNDAFAGNHSVRLETLSAFGNIRLNGVLTTASMICLANGGGQEGGAPFISGVPDSIIGYFKYSPVANDSAYVQVMFLANNDLDTISYTRLNFTESVSNWTRFSAPIEPPGLGETPEKLSLLFNSSWGDGSIGEAEIGSVLLVDDISFVTCSPTTSTATISNCGSYSWNGQTYSQSGTYTYQTTNSSGCDSIAILDLTIDPNIEEFESYTLCDGEAVTVNGTTYTQTGQYTQIIPGGNACDTLLTIDVQSETAPALSILGNTNISPNSGENYAFADPTGYTISWSAVNGTVISGQGTPLATIFWDAIGGGEVSVTLSNNNCSYTYTMAVGTFVSIENHWINDLQIHPNPSTGIFNMELTEPTAIEVFDATGRLVLQATGNGPYSLDLGNEAEGVYSLRLRSDTGVVSFQIVKQFRTTP